MGDPLDEITDEQLARAQELRREAWVAGQFYESLRLNMVPDQLAMDMVFAWWDTDPE